MLGDFVAVLMSGNTVVYTLRIYKGHLFRVYEVSKRYRKADASDYRAYNNFKGVKHGN